MTRELASYWSVVQRSSWRFFLIPSGYHNIIFSLICYKLYHIQIEYDLFARKILLECRHFFSLSSSTFHSRSPLSAYSPFSTVHGSPRFVPEQSSEACCSALFTFLSDQAYHFCFHRLLHGKQSSRHLPPNCCLLMGLLNWNDGVGTMVQDWWCGIDSAGLIVPNY